MDLSRDKRLLQRTPGRFVNFENGQRAVVSTGRFQLEKSRLTRGIRSLEFSFFFVSLSLSFSLGYEIRSGFGRTVGGFVYPNSVGYLFY